MNTATNCVQRMITTSRDLPENIGTHELCTAGEQVAGAGSMLRTIWLGTLPHKRHELSACKILKSEVALSIPFYFERASRDSSDKIDCRGYAHTL
ncbi:hypothetical protein PoB_003904100 [Plakobranchus ocellatus]|uniref:Uncharacterized protein n=1 Tax=Plakobranchus ocellatus TaxID=259542 RepID=A0AAV4AN03_9GAST|nr:hypothetical protein PoB_003904100 [Plakobranchus ocellatus]